MSSTAGNQLSPGLESPEALKREGQREKRKALGCSGASPGLGEEKGEGGQDTSGLGRVTVNCLVILQEVGQEEERRR